MLEFIDKTSEKNGTAINRYSMMAIQGFVDSELVINDDGSITQTFGNGERLTTTIDKENNTITEKFEGEKTIIRTTTFDGKIIRTVIS